MCTSALPLQLFGVTFFSVFSCRCSKLSLTTRLCKLVCTRPFGALQNHVAVPVVRECCCRMLGAGAVLQSGSPWCHIWLLMWPHWLCMRPFTHTIGATSTGASASTSTITAASTIAGTSAINAPKDQRLLLKSEVACAGVMPWKHRWRIGATRVARRRAEGCLVQDVQQAHAVSSALCLNCRRPRTTISQCA